MWPFKKSEPSEEYKELARSPKLDYDPTDMLLQKWDMRGRYAMALGFEPGEDFEKITGYSDPKKLLESLSEEKPPFSDRYKILVEFAIAEQLLFGKDKEEADERFVKQERALGRDAMFRLEVMKHVPALIAGNEGSSSYRDAFAWWKNLEKMASRFDR